jgi:hypothetical protein
MRKIQGVQSQMMTTITTMFLLGVFGAAGAQSIGAKYGTRDPRTCADSKAPARGAMTPALATKYLICSEEKVSGENLYLIEGLTSVEVGGSRPYNLRNDSSEDIDVTAPVYPIRTGSYKSYQCGIVNAGNKGYNCNIYPYPSGSGACRRTTFGDWKCSLGYQTADRSQVQNNVPPPTRVIGAGTDKGNGGAQNGNQPPAGDSGLPQPDLSEMNRYFQVVRSEYNPGIGGVTQLNLLLKMTKPSNICDWDVDFYDADGVKVMSGGKLVGTDTCSPALGQPTRAYAYLPAESKWKYVKKVAITRHIY